VIYLGKLLRENDLNIFLYANKEVLMNDVNSTDIELTFIDPFDISYTIFDCTHGRQEIVRQTINSKPLRHETGIYYAGIKVSPQIFSVGRHIIQWTFKRYPESNLRRESCTFDIVRTAHYVGEFCQSSYSKDKIVL
jgi:hypothetical protein